MDAFWQNIIISLVISLVTGLVTGIITGVISGYYVTRMARFTDLRNEVRQIVWGIEFMYHEGSTPQIRENRPVDKGKLVYVSAELYSLKHKGAGNAVLALQKEITETLQNPPTNFAEMYKRYSNWQQVCRELKPNRFLFSV